MGNPFISDGTAFAQGRAQAQQRPDQGQARSGTFTGTVVKDGSDYMLRDSSGEIFKLDDAERAKPFEGKTVKVTGQLDRAGENDPRREHPGHRKGERAKTSRALRKDTLQFGTRPGGVREERVSDFARSFSGKGPRTDGNVAAELFERLGPVSSMPPRHKGPGTKARPTVPAR